jgi:phosphatidylserine/phosphatidylglycerophosphate/cardiolipin synthase-like enzyme
MKSSTLRSVSNISLAAILAACVSFTFFSVRHLEAASPQVSMCFVPGPTDCATVITKLIDAAKTRVVVQAYSFTSKPIAEALVAAHVRGVDVQAIQDGQESQDQYSILPKLIAAGIPCLVDRVHQIAHNKVMVIDGKIVVTGSFNFTFTADHRNAENVVVIRNPGVAKSYSENFLLHQKHAVGYTPGPAPTPSPSPSSAPAPARPADGGRGN